MYNDRYKVIIAMLSAGCVCQCKYGQRGCRRGAGRGGDSAISGAPGDPRAPPAASAASGGTEYEPGWWPARSGSFCVPPDVPLRHRTLPHRNTT